MNIDELDEDLRDLYSRKTSCLVPPIPSMENRKKETEIVDVCGTCVATQVGQIPVSKVLQRYGCSALPNDPDDPDSTKCVRFSASAIYEITNLDHLAELGSTCTPKLLDYKLTYQEYEDDPLPGGFLIFLIMERLPGHNLNNFFDLPMSERNQVRLAFAKTIREFYALRFRHDDPGRQNLVWDRKNQKCYIVDLEEVRPLVAKNLTWKFVPEIDFYSWEIASPEIGDYEHIDPMVPTTDEYVEDPDDEWLEKLVSDAEGKGPKSHTSPKGPKNIKRGNIKSDTECD
ncbi:hypothetical protein FQN57_000759 [Myotisia sp. PD_48]|nr:hypothetical protein FQN57_000759 [Myotisia sp. PD_48]